MTNHNISKFRVESWKIQIADVTSINIGLSEPGRDNTPKAIFHLVEKDGKLEAVVNLDRLKDQNIPVYLELGAHKILVQP